LQRSSFVRRFRIALLTAGLAASSGWSPSQAADEWTNLTGTSTVTGEMIGSWNGRVLLQLEGGRRVSVRLEDLRADSRILAEKRLVEIRQRLQQRRQEISQAAQAAEAPAPPDAGELPPAPSYTVPPPGADLRTTLVAIRDQTLAGHLRVFYDTLPASHQQQTSELVALGLAKLNTASFESVRSTIHGLAELIVTRQRWLLSHPRLAQLPAEQQQGLIATAGFLRALTSDEVLSLASLRSRTLAESVALIDDAVSPHLYRLAGDPSAGASTFQPDFEVEAGGEGAMIAKVVVPLAGPIMALNFKPVEGRWVLASAPQATGAPAPSTPAPATSAAADDWQQARESLASLPDESLRLPPPAELMLQQFTAAIAPLQQASTQHEFHRALDELLPQLAAVVNQISGFQLPRTPGSAGSYDPSNLYDSETSYDPTLSGSAESMP